MQLDRRPRFGTTNAVEKANFHGGEPLSPSSSGGENAAPDEEAEEEEEDEQEQREATETDCAKGLASAKHTSDQNIGPVESPPTPLGLSTQGTPDEKSGKTESF